MDNAIITNMSIICIFSTIILYLILRISNIKAKIISFIEIDIEKNLTNTFYTYIGYNSDSILPNSSTIKVLDPRISEKTQQLKLMVMDII